MTIAAALREAIASLPERMDRTDAEYLLAHVLERPRAWLYAHADDELAPVLLAEFRVLQARRGAGEPVAYLTGRRGFWSLELQVTPDTLIPRPETERLVELALAFLHPGRPGPGYCHCWMKVTVSSIPAIMVICRAGMPHWRVFQKRNISSMAIRHRLNWD